MFLFPKIGKRLYSLEYSRFLPKKEKKSVDKSTLNLYNSKCTNLDGV